MPVLSRQVGFGSIAAAGSSMQQHATSLAAFSTRIRAGCRRVAYQRQWLAHVSDCAAVLSQMLSDAVY